MQHFKSEWQRESIAVSDECPTHAIDWWIGTLHVDTPNAEVEAGIRERATGKKGWNEAKVAEAVSWAIWKHRENWELYRAVMTGTV